MTSAKLHNLATYEDELSCAHPRSEVRRPKLENLRRQHPGRNRERDQLRDNAVGPATVNRPSASRRWYIASGTRLSIPTQAGTALVQIVAERERDKQIGPKRYRQADCAVHLV